MAAKYTLWVMVGVRQGGLLVVRPSVVTKLVPALCGVLGLRILHSLDDEVC